MCVCALLAFVACEHPDIPESSETMKSFYHESCRLNEVELDSIGRFANKVRAYLVQNPSEANDPFLPDIQQNIQDAVEIHGIQIDTVWKENISIII